MKALNLAFVFIHCCKPKGTDKIMTEKKTITMRKEVIEAIEKVAKLENRNFSNMMETMCLKYLEDKPK